MSTLALLGHYRLSGDDLLLRRRFVLIDETQRRNTLVSHNKYVLTLIIPKLCRPYNRGLPGSRINQLRLLTEAVFAVLKEEKEIRLINYDDIIKAVVPPTQKLAEGEPVWLQFEPTRIHLFDSESGNRIFTTKPDEELECPMPADD